MGRGLSAHSRQIIQNAYDILEREHPSGVRRVAYALYGNQADSEVKRLGKLLGTARKRGLIPWSWISDDTRPSRTPFVVHDAGDQIGCSQQYVQRLRKQVTTSCNLPDRGMRDTNRVCPDYDPWPAQGVRVVIWSEKSLGGTLQPVLDRYLVEFQVHHGNSSLTEIHRTAEWTRTHRESLVILYVGDHDPKGLPINWACRRVAILQHDAEAVDRGNRDADINDAVGDGRLDAVPYSGRLELVLTWTSGSEMATCPAAWRDALSSTLALRFAQRSAKRRARAGVSGCRPRRSAFKPNDKDIGWYCAATVFEARARQALGAGVTATTQWGPR
ncbi:MAG TPA: hypothetical protein VNJ03_17025 [Vicinamibacterales bacterium]|nr:hypothetical protein [Vicinamibacterales bacterium]